MKKVVWLFTPALGVLATSVLAQEEPAGANVVWFNALQGQAPLPETELPSLTRFAVQSITGMLPNNDRSLPPAIADDTAPRIVFLSLSDEKHAAHVVLGAGHGILPALTEAISRVQALPYGVLPPRWLKLDVVNNVIGRGLITKGCVPPFDPSLVGIAFDQQSGLALLPEELIGRGLVKKGSKLRMDRIRRYLAQRPKGLAAFERVTTSSSAMLYQFVTSSAFCDQQEVMPLYRGHRSFDEFSRDELLRTASAGGRYLVGAVDSKGRFRYSYWPSTGKTSSSYNILRHAGTVYAMLELYEVTRTRTCLKLLSVLLRTCCGALCESGPAAWSWHAS